MRVAGREFERVWVATGVAALALMGAASDAAAQVLPWATDLGVGPNEVELTLDLQCGTGGLVCDLLDGYIDVQTATLTGAGDVDVNDAANTFQFQQDSTQDIGAGAQAAYITTDASDVDFASIPLVGVPMVRDAVIFALSNPALVASGLDLGTPGDYPFSTGVDYSTIADIVGDLDPTLPEIVVSPASSLTLSGTFRVLGGTGGFEIRDTVGTISFQMVTPLLGESVTIDVTGDLTLNLLVDPPPPPPVPAIPPWGMAVLASLLAAAARLRLRA